MRLPSRVLLASALFLMASPPGARAKARDTVEPGRRVLEGAEVAVWNVAGDLRVVEGKGGSVEVEVTRGGADAARLTVDVGTEKGISTLRVNYPEDHIVYPEFGGDTGRNSTTSIDYNGRRIHVTGSGPGLEAHADIRVFVPRGKRVNLHLAVGRAFLNGVEGALSFEGASSVQAEGISGGLACDVGSGEIDITRCNAKIAANAGSGDIRISEANGNLSADTGSGNIELKRISAEKIAMDAGSGSIDGSDIQVGEMSANCGSGTIDLDGTAAAKMSLDAGSGSVVLHLTKNVEDLAIDAGSGSVRLEAPEELSARFRIECPRRNLHIGFPADYEVRDDDVAAGTIGNGRGRIRIEAGSGSVELVKM